MSIKSKQIIITRSANLSYRDCGEAFDISQEAASVKLARGLTKISDFIKLCEYCKAEITIKLQDGSVLTLTTKDI